MIYCDLDGVLADFSKSFLNLTGKLPSEVERPELWKIIEETPSYWLNLEKMPDAAQLMRYLNHFHYQILTGLPAQGYQKAKAEKKKWVATHIHPNIKIICCLSKNKGRYCQRGDILIDDYPANIHRWKKAGGIGILHTTAKDTIRQLKSLGYKKPIKPQAPQVVQVNNALYIHPIK